MINNQADYSKISATPTPFRRKIRDVEEYLRLHTKLHEYLIENLGPLRDGLCQELEVLSSTLKEKAKELERDLKSPTLVIAIAGTTSSAKSTTINLLCGADLMPMEVGEISAGVVVIRPFATSCLVIKPTKDALWDCGTFKDLSADEIRARLTGIMTAFQNAREVAKKDPSKIVPAAPKVEVEYPLRGDLKSLLGVTEDIQLELRDLPGIKSLNDETNRKELKECEDALILLAFDAKETDTEKQKNLLGELVALIEALGGSPQRFFFFASRVDAYRQNHSDDWPENENRFITKLWERIKTEITARRPNYAEELAKMQLHRLSPRPACLAYKMRAGVSTDRTLVRQLSGYLYLVDPEYWLGSPTAPNYNQQWQFLSQKLDGGAYTAQFFDGMKAHIQTRLFELVMQPVVGKFIQYGIAPYKRTAVQIINTQLDSTEEHFERAKKELDDAEPLLEEMLEEMEEQIRGPFEKLRSELDELRQHPTEASRIGKLFDKLSDDLAKVHKAIRRELTSLSSWDANIKVSVDNLLEYCLKTLSEGAGAAAPVDALILQGNYPFKFHAECEELRRAGYEEFAQTGRTYIKEENPGKVNLLSERLDVFDRTVMEWINALLEDQGAKQLSFAYDALDCLCARHAEIVARKAEAISAKIGFETLTLDVKRVSDVQLSRIINGVSQPMELIQSVRIGSEEEYIDRVPLSILGWTIWTLEFKRTRTVYKDHWQTSVPFPGVEDLNHQYHVQIDRVYQMVEWEFTRYMEAIIDDITADVSNKHLELFARYKKRLEEVREDAQSDRDQNMDIWNVATILERNASTFCDDRVTRSPEIQ